jgi:hypothetical protein
MIPQPILDYVDGLSKLEKALVTRVGCPVAFEITEDQKLCAMHPLPKGAPTPEPEHGGTVVVVNFDTMSVMPTLQDQLLMQIANAQFPGHTVQLHQIRAGMKDFRVGQRDSLRYTSLNERIVLPNTPPVSAYQFMAHIYARYMDFSS